LGGGERIRGLGENEAKIRGGKVIDLKGTWGGGGGVAIGIQVKEKPRQMSPPRLRGGTDTNSSEKVGKDRRGVEVHFFHRRRVTQN